jgi:hypothetical protein
MTEVAGEAAHYLARLKFGEDIDAWAAIGATILREMVSKGDSERARLAEFTRSWQGRFDADRSIDAYLSIYKKIFGSI